MIETVTPTEEYAEQLDAGAYAGDWAEHQRRIQINGRQLNFVDSGARTGAGQPAVILVHGMGGRWQHWLPVLPALAEHRRVVALDLPGFGASQRPTATPTAETFADTAAALCRELRIDRAVLAGHSMGGPIALRFGIRHPQLAAGLISVAGAVTTFSQLLGLRRLLKNLRKHPREFAAIYAEVLSAALPAPAALKRAVARSASLRRVALFPYAYRPGELTAADAALLVDGAGAPGVLSTAAAIGRTPDPYWGLDHLRCPLLSVVGDHDLIVPLSDTRGFAERAPQHRTVVVEGSGHMIMLERPRAFLDIVVPFLEQIGG
ncbi:alpha/beta fold hydrolase [Mycolicibacterium arseniciresistens]|uniref:Alpha/beta hydrolase n=1 Tax=Mycolicibacterium arseniciresistens TaxID=3062257 RepID=A0ABT8UJJ7_9MYCO|nr:alpha/beta hydrolase [Mycolicibacterium arseniciresistens]MDO3637968.1 alpha/beta hydrolase [Mycolicibacterium arseniciresistens]